MAYDRHEERTLEEATLAQREAMRRYNWLVRATPYASVRCELNELMNQIGKWPIARDVERTITKSASHKGPSNCLLDC